MASFEINDLLYNLACTVNPSIEHFDVKDAKIEFGSLDQLTTTRQFYGKIGKNQITMSLANGPKITGVLGKLMDPASSIVGQGTWTQN